MVSAVITASEAPKTTANRALSGPLPTTWTRRLDLVYYVFFLIHIPVMFCEC